MNKEHATKIKKENGSKMYMIEADVCNGLQEVSEFQEETSVKLGFDLFLSLIKKDFNGIIGVIVTQKEYDFLQKEYGIN